MGPMVLLFILILVPLAVAIAGYVMLRQRQRSPLVAGCSSIVVGGLLSFLMTGLFYLAGWA